MCGRLIRISYHQFPDTLDLESELSHIKKAAKIEYVIEWMCVCMIKSHLIFHSSLSLSSPSPPFSPSLSSSPLPPLSLPSPSSPPSPLLPPPPPFPYSLFFPLQSKGASKGDRGFEDRVEGPRRRAGVSQRESSLL